MNTGKIDGLERTINKLAEDFRSLEDKQITVLQRHIETSAASIIAAIKKDNEEIKQSLLIMTSAIKGCVDKIAECSCNKEILEAFEKRLSSVPTATPVGPTSSIGMARDEKSPTGVWSYCDNK